jgi:anti-sigma factor RsiW
MHPTEGQLQAYTDRSLPIAESERIAAHLAGCPLCQAQAQGMAERTHRVQSHLTPLNPQPGEAAPTVAAARYRLQTKLNQKESQSMYNKLFSSRMRPVWGALVILLVLTVALSFPQVRAAANSFLGLFRVQQVAFVPVDANAVSEKMASFDGNLLNTLFAGATEEAIGQSVPNASVEEASAAAGIRVRLPEVVDLSNLSVEQGTRVSFQVDQPTMQAIFDETELDIEIPAALDGATVTGEIPPVVFASFNCSTQTVTRPSDPDDPDAGSKPVEMQICDNLVQVASPTINAPAGVDISAIGEGFLQLMGMSEEDAKNYSQTVDWATTLVIPVPRTASYENVNVDGGEGVVLRETPSAEGHYILVWSKDGVVYGLSGEGSNDEALAVANSLK